MKFRASRRRALAGIAATAAISASTVARALSANTRPSLQFSSHTITLVHESLVIDLLNQFLYRIDQQARLDAWLDTPGAFREEDWRRFIDTGINAIGFGDGADDRAGSLELLRRWNGFFARYPDRLLRIDHANDFGRAKQSSRFGILINFQNGSHFDTVDDVDVFYGLGQRMSQLTYNGQNQLASGAFVEKDEGVTELGAKVIARMNAIGMAVDIAHASDRAKRDVLALSNRPVILSHGACYALNPHPRTIKDADIKCLAESGGVMGIAFVANMLSSKPSEDVTVDDVIDHIDHIVQLVGIEHVGIGSDAGIETHDLAPPSVQKEFWSHISPLYRQQGGREAPVGLDRATKFFTLTEALIRRGYTDSQIHLILGENWRRVLQAIWHG